MSRPIRAVVVGGTAPSRARLAQAVEADGDIAVVAEVDDVAGAASPVRQRLPDIALVHLDDPRSMENLEQVLGQARLPVLALTTTGRRGAGPSARAGRWPIDTLENPPSWSNENAAILRDRARATARKDTGDGQGPPPPAPQRRAGSPVVGIAGSTGGPSAVASVISGLNTLPAPILVVQHIDAGFVDEFVRWLGSQVSVPVEVAEDGALPQAGTVHVAPGGRHLRLGAGGRLSLDAAPQRINCPSADELFHSLARNAGSRAVGIVVTGMGSDGADGLLALRQAGGTTFGQNGDTCAVFGMPRAAHERGALDRLLPLPNIAGAVRDAVRRLA